MMMLMMSDPAAPGLSSTPPPVALGRARASALEKSIRAKIDLHAFAPQVKKAVFYPNGRACADTDVLAEFIVLMISDGKSKADVNAELGCLIGGKYTALFGEWLFDELESVLADPDLEDDAENKENDEVRRLSVSTCRPSGSTAAGALNESDDRIPRSSSSSRDGRGSATRNTANRRRRPAEEPAARYLRLRALLAERLGAAGGAVPTPASFVKKTAPRVAAAAASCTPEERRMDREALEAAVAKAEKEARNKSVRCQYWPRCGRGGGCRFRHPSELCRAFPNCPNTAMECVYIHPAVDGFPGLPAGSSSSSPDPRRPEGSDDDDSGGTRLWPVARPPFRLAATRRNPGDLSGHQPPAPAGRRSPVGGVGGGGTARRSNGVCRFGTACYRPNCKYNHNPAPVPI